MKDEFVQQVKGVLEHLSQQNTELKKKFLLLSKIYLEKVRTNGSRDSNTIRYITIMVMFMTVMET